MVWLLSKSKASTQLGIDEYQAVVTISIEIFLAALDMTTNEQFNISKFPQFW